MGCSWEGPRCVPCVQRPHHVLFFLLSSLLLPLCLFWLLANNPFTNVFFQTVPFTIRQISGDDPSFSEQSSNFWALWTQVNFLGHVQRCPAVVIMCQMLPVSPYSRQVVNTALPGSLVDSLSGCPMPAIQSPHHKYSKNHLHFFRTLCEYKLVL